MYTISGLPSKIKRQNFREKTGPGIYYHYTSLSTLWAVLDSECLRATQACFSNDSEEVAKGKRLIAEIYREKYNNFSCSSLNQHEKVLFDETESNIDCYIVCFCGEDDKLSQWRAYCRNDGVSIGFAFDGTEPHYYYADQPYNIQTMHDVELFPVWYLEECDTSHAGFEKHVISKEALKENITNLLDEIKELSDKHHETDFLLSTIPLIKHAGFYEEDEHRLLIRNAQSELGGTQEFPLDSYVKYHTDEGVKKPYLNICFGKNYPNKDALSSYSACSPENVQYISLYNIDTKMVSAIQTAILPINVTSYSNDGPQQIVIGPAPDCLQKQVFEKIETVINDTNNNSDKASIKIWCEGHLPIRSICVSPCENQDQVVRSIKHYCLHKKFWLKYVDVYGSSIPYRRPR